jgi:hypothetical protein
MDLNPDWEYILEVAHQRLKHNKTWRHVSRYGKDIEVLGAAGELAARRFLGLPERLHTEFDAGVDLIWRGHTVDVKATILTPNVRNIHLQWPHWKPIKSELILMTAIDLEDRQATVIGFTDRDHVAQATINPERDTPCHEIPVTDLSAPYELFTFRKRPRRPVVHRSQQSHRVHPSAAVA